MDCDDLGIAPGADFEILFSAERPAGHTGHWAPIDPQAGGMYVRYRMYDWETETDPQLTIECLDPVPPKPRLSPAEIAGRMREMARFPGRKTRLYYPMQNGVNERVGFNVFEPVRMPGAMAGLSSDGRFRGVIALRDPGVPNWLDPAGYTEGGIYGRWYDCSSAPVPTITRVKLADLRAYLPIDTPVVTPDQRREEIARRVRACQRRRRW